MSRRLVGMFNEVSVDLGLRIELASVNVEIWKP